MHQTPEEEKEEKEEEEIDAFQHGSTYVPHSIYKEASLLDRFGFDPVKPWRSNSPNSGWTFLIREALCR